MPRPCTLSGAQKEAAPESAAQLLRVPPSVAQAESPPAAAGAAADSLPDDEPSPDLELSDDAPLPLDDDADSVADSLLSELSAGRLGRP